MGKLELSHSASNYCVLSYSTCDLKDAISIQL